MLGLGCWGACGGGRDCVHDGGDGGPDFTKRGAFDGVLQDERCSYYNNKRMVRPTMTVATVFCQADGKNLNSLGKEKSY